MSLEQLLFIFLLLGVPLLERLARMLRERMADSREEPAFDDDDEPAVSSAPMSRPEVARSSLPAQPDTGGRTAEGRRMDVPLPVPPLPASPFPAPAPVPTPVAAPAPPFVTPPLPEAPAVVRPKVVREAPPKPLHSTEREPRKAQVARRGPATAPRVGRPERAVFAGKALRGLPASELRRAVVLMAILGPCRALEAKDTSLPG